MPQYDLSGLVNPSLQQLNRSPTGQTANPLLEGWYPPIPNQGNPTFTPGSSAISLPAGYYGGGTVKPIRVATGTVTSSSSTEGFYLYGGSEAFGNALTIPVPSGAQFIIMVTWIFDPATDPPTSNLGAVASGWATPLGYADGATSTVLAVSQFGGSGATSAFISGGSLSLTTSSIVVPSQVSSNDPSVPAYYSVYYI
jgi:hypothetical protein